MGVKLTPAEMERTGLTRDQQLAARRARPAVTPNYAPTSSAHRPTTATNLTPLATGARPPTSSGTTGTTDSSWMQNPDIANVVLSLMELGLSDAQAQATIQWYYDQMNSNMEFSKWSTQAELAASTKNAQIAASSGNANAQIDANARLEAAQIAADSAERMAQLDSQTRLKIAADEIQAQLKIKAAELEDTFQARVARETTAPTDWPYQLALLKNRNPVTAPRSGVSGALGVPAAQQIYSRAGAAPSPVAPSPALALMDQGNAAWQSFQAGQPTATVVGDGGPEILQPTPQGTNVIPINSQSLANRAKYLPKMQAGGFVPRYEAKQATNSMGPAQSLLNPLTKSQQIRAGRPGVKGTSYTAPVGEMGLWGGRGSRRQPNFNRHYVEGQGWVQGHDPLWAQVQGKFAQPVGVQPGVGGNLVSVEPTVPTATPGMEGFSDILWDPWAAFQATTAPRMTSQGVYTKRWPWEENYADWTRLPTQVQAARLAAWRDAGVIEGDTASEMMSSALQMMIQSAPIGSGTAMAGYR